MKNIFKGIVLALVVLFFTTAVGLAFIHISGFPFSLDVVNLNISGTSGLPREEILQNYNAMMDYLSPFSDAEFTLPTMNYSDSGSYHFAQCKALFRMVYLFGFASGVCLIIIAVKKAASRKTIRISAFITIAFTLLLNCAFSINSDKAFVLFHLMFFKGKSWIFDPKLDEIIKILPLDYFIHCAYFFAALWLIAAASQFVLCSSKK